MAFLENPWRAQPFPGLAELEPGEIETNPAAARGLFARCPRSDGTPLRAAPKLAKAAGIGELYIKDERGRMGLGSFKALGAAHAIAKLADSRPGRPETALEGEVFICASAGNHGLSVAAGARAFGARAVIYLPETVPEIFAARLREKGAEVVREGADYEISMAAAMKAAEREGWRLLADLSWPGYSEPARDVMEGYLIMAAEAADQAPAAPDYIFLQAGVGGIAAAAAAMARRVWGDAPRIIVVEPEAAPAIMVSIAAGRFKPAKGPASIMGRLDCKEASHLALKALARMADGFMTISEAEGQEAADRLGAVGLNTTPSGAAGYAGLTACRNRLELSQKDTALIYLTEGAE